MTQIGSGGAGPPQSLTPQPMHFHPQQHNNLAKHQPQQQLLLNSGLLRGVGGGIGGNAGSVGVFNWLDEKYLKVEPNSPAEKRARIEDWRAQSSILH